MQGTVLGIVCKLFTSHSNPKRSKHTRFQMGTLANKQLAGDLELRADIDRSRTMKAKIILTVSGRHMLNRSLCSAAWTRRLSKGRLSNSILLGEILRIQEILTTSTSQMGKQTLYMSSRVDSQVTKLLIAHPQGAQSLSSNVSFVFRCRKIKVAKLLNLRSQTYPKNSQPLYHRLRIKKPRSRKEKLS